MAYRVADREWVIGVNTAEARRLLVQRRLAARRANGGTGNGTGHGHPSIPAADRDQPLPLSFGQERLWFENQRAPDSAEYQVPVVLRIESPLDRQALDAAYRTVVTRHEILRTRYQMRHARPFQVIDPPDDVHIDVTDLSETPDAALDVARREIAAPFNLGLEHPVRLRLLRLGDTEHVLVLTLHHICCDGTSLSLLVTELFETYGRIVAGDDAEPSPPRVQYADYAVWQRDQLAGGVLDEHVRYWCERLADQPALDLPIDRPRAAVRDPDGDRCQFTVPTDLVAGLRELARGHNTTLYTVTLTAFQVLLARYSGQRDIAVGSALTARQRPELRDAVGFYIDTAVLRASWGGDPPFTEVLAGNRTAVLEAIEHQAAPLQRVAEELGIARDPSRPALFQVMFDLVDAAPERFELGGLSLRRLDVIGTIAKHDLRLELAEAADGTLTATIEYPTALFEHATVARFGEHYLRLLAAIVADPHTQVGELPLLDTEDRRWLLARATGRGADLPQASLSDVLAAQACRVPSRIAVVAEGERLTFAELDAEANRFARQLAERGAGRASLVGVCLDRGIDLLPTLLGVWRCGAASLPLDPADPPERLAHILRDAGCAVLVTEWQHLQRLPGSVTDAVTGDVLLVDIERAGIDAQDSTPLERDDRSDDPDGKPDGDPDANSDVHLAVNPAVHLDELAYVVYTSGSTGRPKGVEVTHGAVRNYLESVARTYFANGDGTADPDGRGGAGTDDHGRGGAALLTSVAFDMAVTSLYAPLLVGEPVHLLPGDLGPAELLRELARDGGYRVVKLTPSHLELLTRSVTPEQAAALTSTLVVGGEGFPADLARRWFDLAGDTATVVNEYGPTENTVASVICPLARVDDVRAGASGLLPIGSPTPNTTAYVLDESLRPVPVGVAGELCLGGAQLARGYHGLPAETARRFVADPYGPPGGRLYRTGDRATLRPDGQLEFLGRADDQLAVRGFRVEPAEIVAALREHPAITEAAVVQRDTQAGSLLVGYLVSAGEQPATQELRAFLAQTLPAHMIPAAFVYLTALPTTTAGKLDHRALPKPDRAALGLPPEPTRPPTELERRIADAWRELLGMADDVDVGVDDSYFDLGGDSVNAVAIVGRLREAGLDVTVQDLFEHPTVGELAAALAPRPALSDDRTRVAPFELLTDHERQHLPDDVVDAYPLSMLQAGMLYEMLSSGSDVHYYHNATTYTIRDDAPLDNDAFQRAVDALVARHEMLRTGFDLSGGRPLQYVHPNATLTVGTADIRGLSASEQDSAVRDYMRQQRGSLFRVDTPPLFALFTHVVDDTTWHLTITECHPILEGWGYHLLLMELLAHYRALRDGKPPPEPEPLPVRYADFIAAEQASLAADDDSEFWRGIVTTTPKFTLPAEWAASTPQPPKPVVLEVMFVDLLDELRELGRLAGAPLKSVLHAAHLTVMSTLTEQSEFYTGLVCDTRPEIYGAERMPGLFLNTVPFRFQHGATTWRELVRTVFDTEIALWPHRRYPMYAMQREHWPGGRLIDVLFNYLDFHSVDTDLVDFNASVDDSPNEFRLAATAFAQGMVSLRFHLDAVSMRDGERLVGMYRSVLAAMASDPDGGIPRSFLSHAFDVPASTPESRSPDSPIRSAVAATGRTVSAATSDPHQPAVDVVEVERLLTEAWVAALDVDRIDAHDDLTELGADSLKGLRVAAVLAQRGYELSPMAAISYPTIAELAPHVRRR